MLPPKKNVTLVWPLLIIHQVIGNCLILSKRWNPKFKLCSKQKLFSLLEYVLPHTILVENAEINCNWTSIKSRPQTILVAVLWWYTSYLSAAGSLPLWTESSVTSSSIKIRLLSKSSQPITHRADFLSGGWFVLEGFTVYQRLALNSWSFCLSFLSSGITRVSPWPIMFCL